MILLSTIAVIISLLFQGLASNFQSVGIDNISILSTIFPLITFVVLQPYYESNKKFLILIIIFGILFDIIYTGTLILCTTFFILIFFINKVLNFFFPSNIFTVNIFSMISIIIYHCLSFTFLKIVQYDSYGVATLIKVLYSNIIMTIIYTTIVYYIINYFYKRLELKIIRD